MSAAELRKAAGAAHFDISSVVIVPRRRARGAALCADRSVTPLGLAAGLVWEWATFRKWEDGYSFVCAAPRRPVRAYGDGSSTIRGVVESGGCISISAK